MKAARIFLSTISVAAGLNIAVAEEVYNPVPQDDSEPITNEILRLDAEMRLDYDHINHGSHTYKPGTGFEGKYLMLRVDGTIVPGLTYSWRQRLNKTTSDFAGTDWVYLNYDYNRWNFSTGKEVVGIGGFEYDRAPIDLYGSSVFWNNIPCFKFGATAGYGITDSDRLSFQVTESPFVTSGNHDMYGFNLRWNGRHGFFESIYSANLMEYAEDRFISYLALGNKFYFGNMWLEFDFMNRAASHQPFFFKDCSVMTELSYTKGDSWRIYGKYTYDVNHSGTAADLVVMDGTEMNMGGAGLEYFPLKSKRHRLRLHAGCFYYWGKNGNLDNFIQDKTLYISTGVTWDMNILNIKHK